MKSLSFLVLGLFGLNGVAFGQDNFPTNPDRAKYEYFVKEDKIGSSRDTIMVKKNGDTTLVVYFNGSNVRTSSHQEITKTYKGTPYFNNGWYKGLISFDNNLPLSFSMSFNLEKGVVFYVDRLSHKTTEIRPEEFSLQGHTFRIYANQYRNAHNYYYENIYDGKSKLLKNYACILVGTPVIPKTGYEPEGNGNEFEGEFKKTVFYFMVIDNEVRQIIRPKNSLKWFGDKKEIVQEYISKNKINIKSEAGMIAMIKYYDSL